MSGEGGSSSKADSIANQLRLEGNLLYKDKKFFEALAKYNESLCNAESKEILALTFNNRSSVYFEIKLYPQCLNNIRLAREWNYPAEKLSTLADREARCQEILKRGQSERVEFFKLSYEANNKMPFTIDALELKSDIRYGRGVFTKQDLKVGDILSVEPPSFKVLNSNPRITDGRETNKFNYCRYCLKDKLFDLLPCDDCNNTMYCDENCKTQAAPVHRYEVEISDEIPECTPPHKALVQFYQCLALVNGSVDRLKELFTESQISPKSVFDINFRAEESEVNEMKFLAAVCLAKDSMDFSGFGDQLFELHPQLRDFGDEHEEFIRKFLVHLYQVQRHTVSDIVSWSLIGGANESIGVGNFLLGALVNHSCSPNVQRLFVDDKMVLLAIRPISKGEQLFDCYLEPFYKLTLEERQALLKIYSFKCICEACFDPVRYSTTLQVKNEKLYRYANKLVKEMDGYNSVKRKVIIQTAKTLESKMQNSYDPRSYPNLEYRTMYACYLDCLFSLGARHSFFKF